MGQAWVDQIFQVGQVSAGNIVRRSLKTVMENTSPQELENEVRRRGFHMALIGDQFVIICNRQGGINVIC